MKKLAWRRTWALRRLLSDEVQTMSCTEVSSCLLVSFHFDSTPDEDEYWDGVYRDLRYGRIELDDEIRAKLVAIMLMPTEIEEYI